ncbi:MAG TPA: CoA transferase [Myxococcota bacterium]|nr:CoA transferase [Myxococcota bacterium]
MHALRELRVVDFSTGIAGAYATKLFADAGADVVKLEPPEGDPLRAWSATGADLGGEDGALFRFLHHSKRAVVGRIGEKPTEALVAAADLVVESGGAGGIDGVALRARFPGLVVLSLTPFGRGGPLAGRAATEFTLQAEGGSIATRGLRGREPFQAGGRIGEWVSGTFAAVAALAAARRARQTGHGEHIDFSLLECIHIAASNYLDLFHGLLGRPPARGLPQAVETPSIEPTADGWVGFCTNSAQQFADFLLLIERPELRDDPALAQAAGRFARLPEWEAIVHAFTRKHPTAEIVERASLLRIPVSPVNDARGALEHEQLVARGAFIGDPTGRFRMPRPPYAIDGERPPPPRPAPQRGEHTGAIDWPPRQRPAPAGPPRLPLEGLRILDFTAWWAGPSATHMLASLGADVIHVESTARPDGMRMMAGAFRSRDLWWERSPFFLAANANKRGLALDLSDPRGRALALRLVEHADALVENFTPRVMDGFGLDASTLRAANPRLIHVRMPAFGLDGPWRDRTGFAQTMEQMTGMAWITGHPDDQPRIQRGPCDPLAGMHAAFALLVALAGRDADGRGRHVECAMVEGALNAAAEQIVEYTAHGRLMQRMGNRSPEAAPQGLYACKEGPPEDPSSTAQERRWLALAVASDAQWRALAALLGRAPEPGLDECAGRRAAHDRIDTELRRWCAARPCDEAVEALQAAGIPAAPVRDPRLSSRHPQLVARRFFEVVEHPVIGAQPLPTLPFRYASVPRWLRRPPPTLGQHSREVLHELLGLGDGELDVLERDGVIGTRPKGL